MTTKLQSSSHTLGARSRSWAGYCTRKTTTAGQNPQCTSSACGFGPTEKKTKRKKKKKQECKSTLQQPRYMQGTILTKPHSVSSLQVWETRCWILPLHREPGLETLTFPSMVFHPPPNCYILEHSTVCMRWAESNRSLRLEALKPARALTRTPQGSIQSLAFVWNFSQLITHALASKKEKKKSLAGGFPGFLYTHLRLSLTTHTRTAAMHALEADLYHTRTGG